MEKYFAIIPFGVGLFAIAGIFWPRVRGVWRGSSQTIGIVAAIGFALIFITAGFGLLGYSHLGIPFLVGIVCAFVGQSLDFRKRKKL